MDESGISTDSENEQLDENEQLEDCSEDAISAKDSELTDEESSDGTPDGLVKKISKVSIKQNDEESGSKAEIHIQHPKFSEMVIEAVLRCSSSDTRSGVSVQAIKKYIIQTYGLEEARALPRIRTALKRVVDEGAVVQVSGAGASGSFKLPKPVKSIKTSTVNAVQSSKSNSKVVNVNKSNLNKPKSAAKSVGSPKGAKAVATKKTLSNKTAVTKIRNETSEILPRNLSVNPTNAIRVKSLKAKVSTNKPSAEKVHVSVKSPKGNITKSSVKSPNAKVQKIQVKSPKKKEPKISAGSPKGRVPRIAPKSPNLKATVSKNASKSPKGLKTRAGKN